MWYPKSLLRLPGAVKRGSEVSVRQTERLRLRAFLHYIYLIHPRVSGAQSRAYQMYHSLLKLSQGYS